MDWLWRKALGQKRKQKLDLEVECCQGDVSLNCAEQLWLKSEVDGGTVLTGPRIIYLTTESGSGYMEVHSPSHPTFVCLKAFHNKVKNTNSESQATGDCRNYLVAFTAEFWVFGANMGPETAMIVPCWTL